MEKHNHYFANQEDEINLREEVEKYLSYWHWFILGIIVCVSLAFIYLRYENPKYKATASIKVKDESKGGMISELAAFSDLDMLSNVKNNVDNEVVILQSKTLIGKTILNLGLNYDYKIEANVRDTPVYDDSPIKIEFKDTIINFLKKDTLLFVKKIDNKKFELLNSNKESAGIYIFNAPIQTKLGKLFVYSKNNKFADYTIIVNIKALNKTINNYKESLTVEPYSKTTSIINLNKIDEIKKRAEDFLNTLIYNYQKDALNDANEIASNTSVFINNRLSIINNELDGVERQTESFKRINKLTDIKSEAGIYLETASSVEKELVSSETELKIINMMLDVFKSSNTNDLIPANILPNNGSANDIIKSYNELILEKKRISNNVTSNNSTLQKLDQQIVSLRETIHESLINLKRSSDLKTNKLSQQSSEILGKIKQIPTQEREFRILARQQQIKEGLYLYLLQKREETEISLNVASTNSKFIDKAFAEESPVSPKKSIVLLASLLLGLLIPFIIIYVKDLLDVKIKTPAQLKKILSASYLGELPKTEDKQLVGNISRSEFAEALRIIKTNLNFIISTNKSDLAKVIFVTSTVPKEGKTFVSANIASIFSETKKTLLIGLDIRNPRLDEHFTLPKKGITNYISSDSENIDEFIVKINKDKNLYVIPGGIIPPNPMEILSSEKLANVLEELKHKFDVIIIDTAPISPVSDTISIANLSDLFIYVVRSNYLDKRMLQQTDLLYKDGKIKNMSVILNFYNNMSKYGYGYGYGYTEKTKSKKWYKFWNK